MPRHPDAASPLVAAIASGRLDSSTAARNATLTVPASSTVSPSTADSGMPSRMMPSTMARADPPACLPAELLRPLAPKRSSNASPT